MTAWPEPFLRCPECSAWDHHFLEHRPSPPGARASWPDEAAPHWRYECRSCGHVWRVPA